MFKPMAQVITHVQSGSAVEGSSSLGFCSWCGTQGHSEGKKRELAAGSVSLLSGWQCGQPCSPQQGLTLGVVPGTHEEGWDMVFLGLKVFPAHRTVRLKPGRVQGKPRALPGLSNLRQQQRPGPLTPA